MKTLPLSELRADLAACICDLGRLRAICKLMGEFIANNHGEDRSHLVATLQGWQARLDNHEIHKTRLEAAIERARK